MTHLRILSDDPNTDQNMQQSLMKPANTMILDWFNF
jgi:hypothetical protein